MSALAPRLRTAAVLLLLLLPALVLRETGRSEAPWLMLVAAGGLAAAWEWAGLLRPARAFRAAAAAACALLALGLALLPAAVFAAAFWLALGLWGVALLRIAGVPLPGAAEPVFFAMLGLSAIPVAGWIMVDFPGPFLWSFLAVVVVADSAAYVFGRRYGRVALAPELSPGKTRGGLLGALLAVAALGLALAWALGLPAAAWFYFVCLALLAACFSVIGDLAVSLLKRRAKVKDSGRLLPGHGGALDRLDGLLAAAPVFYLGVRALQEGLQR